MKEKLSNLIHKLFEVYECEPKDFIAGWLTISAPAYVVFQIIFFFYAYYYMVPDHKYKYRIEVIADSLWWAFGGIMVYLLLTLLTILVSAIIHKRSYKIIILIIGAIGTFLAYNRIK